MDIGFGEGPIPGFDPISGTPRLTPDNVRLRILNGPEIGKAFRVRRAQNLIGRSTPFGQVHIDLGECELDATDPKVSRRHAEMQWIEGELHLVDLASRNGTFIDGEILMGVQAGHPSEPKLLRYGHKVKFANVEVTVDEV